MARAAAKKKRDIPPLYMLVADGGRLAPAFQHDEERLMSFRKGTRLVVTVEPDGSRRGVRKWHAIIGKAVKNGLLPWLTASAADEGLRLALDMWEPKRAKNNSYHRVTQSLDALTDEELDEKIELMTALVYKLSGVDPDDFKREMAGAGDERFASEYDRPAAANDAGSATHSPDENPDAPSSGEVLTDSAPSGEDSSGASLPSQDAGAADLNSAEATKLAMVPDAEVDSAGDPASTSAAGAPNSAEVTAPETGAHADSGGADAQPVGTAAPAGEDLTGLSASPAAELSDDDRQWLRDGARMMLACEPAPEKEALTVLFNQVRAIITSTPKTTSKDARDRLDLVLEHCRAVCKGQIDLDVPLVARTALSTVAEVTPAPVKTARAK